MGTPHVVGIGGTTRAGSSTEKALRYALREAEELGAATTLYAGSELAELPMYAPEDPARTDLARRFIADLRAADGVIIASPGYHGTVSGMVKNALDYIEDMRDDPRSYFDGLPIGCIATGAGWQATVETLQTLRAIAHALRGWPTPLGAAIKTVGIPVFGENGDVVDERARFQLETIAREVVEFAHERNNSLEPAGR